MAEQRPRVALALMVASGFAALAYQIVWTQQSALWLGHESAAILAVVAAFFGGMGAGAFALGERIERSRQPGRWYAACELVIGAWGIVLTFALQPVSHWLVDAVGPQPSPLRHWSIAFCGTLLVLLPATAAMGATLPAMERALAGLHNRSNIAVLYAGNTLGAVLGLIAAAFWLVPELGLQATTLVCAALNVAAAIAAALSFSGSRQIVMAKERQPARDALLLLTATGLLGIGYEVLVVRVLSQVAENTVYTFALLLALYLVGTALGAAAYARWICNHVNADHARNVLLRLLAMACLLGALSLSGAQHLKTWVLSQLGNSMAAALLAEATMAAIAFLPATFLMGALFSHLSTSARAAGIGFGRALAVNTFGAAAAPWLCGVMLVPALGTKATLLSLAMGYVLASSWRAWRVPTQWFATAAVVATALWSPTLVIVEVPAGGRLISHTEGVLGTVSIVEDADGVARLHINNRQQEGSSATLLADARQALLPILLHPSPRQALFLGLGTGVTAASAAQEAALHVDAVELVPEVIDASTYFTRELITPRLHVMSADARRFVSATTEQYDVIVADNFHPARSGSGSLYTVEHFTAIRARLARDGLFCQWLPLHQLDLETLRSIVRAFAAAFPHGWAMLATNSLETPVLGLVAHVDARRFDRKALQARLQHVRMPRMPSEFGIADELSLLGGFIAGPRALRDFAGDARMNTDDVAVVAYRAPRITYAPDSLPRERLIALLREIEIDPSELLSSDANDPTPSRLAAYWAARDRFLEVGLHVQPTPDVQRMIAQVRDPLLGVLRISPEFQPAYDPLLRMATALAPLDASAAQALLLELQRVQPARPEAGEVLRSLAGGW